MQQNYHHYQTIIYYIVVWHYIGGNLVENNENTTITFHGGVSHSLKSPLFQTMNISTMSEVYDNITNTTSTKSSSSNIFDLYMQNRSIGEPYYSGLDHVAFSITE